MMLYRYRHNAASQAGAQPYFLGNWNGQRNNWFGDVGISFIAERDFKIVSLGRHWHNQTGLHDTVKVSLWSVEAQSETPDQALAEVMVGPNSFREGHYAWEPVSAPGVVISQGREYRISQACTPGMHDKWYD